MDKQRIKKYKDFDFFEFSDELLEKYKLKKVFVDSVNWMSYYENQKSNWIEFYPFSEYHGGGQSYIIRIGTNEYDKWLLENPEFIKSIRDNLI